MEKIITLPKLQLFLTKCKGVFALKKHTHTASDITGLPSGGSQPTTLYGDSADAGGLYPVFNGGSKNASLFDWMGHLLMRTRNPENPTGSGIEFYYGDANDTKAVVVNSSKGVSISAPSGEEVINANANEVNVKDVNGNSRLKITPTNASVKHSGKGLDVSADKTSLYSDKEVRLESSAGAGTSLRLSEKDVHLDGIDGGMMLSSRASLPTDWVSYDMNLPLKDKLGDAAPTTPPVKGIRLHKSYVELTGPDNSLYGDCIYLGNGVESSSIDVEAQYIDFNYQTDIKVDGDIVPSIFPTRTMPDLNKLGLNQGHVFVVPDGELTYRYMYDHVENICVFRNESNTMCFLKNGTNAIQPLPFPVFVSVTDDVMGLFDDDFMFYAYNDFTGKWELYCNIQAELFTTQYPDDGSGRLLFEKFTTMPIGSDGGMLGHCNAVSLSRALVLLAKVAENQGMANN